MMLNCIQNMPEVGPASAALTSTLKAASSHNALTLESIFTPEAIFKGYSDAFRGKHYRPRYFKFKLSLGSNLSILRQSVLDGTYEARPPSSFLLFCNSGQKTREIHASAVTDIVVQRTLYNALYPVFDKVFIYDNYGCRKGKGTLKAADQCQRYIRASPKDSYYLQLDMRKFYYNIDHNVMRQELAKKIHDPRTLQLCMQFVCHSPSEYSYTPYAPNVGLDVGAMISQLYGLIYLNRLDQYAKRSLGIKHYIRYVDDVLIIGESKERCLELKQKLTEYLRSTLKLELSAAFIQPISKGINFAGFRTWREYRLVRKFSVRNFNRRLNATHLRPASIQAMLAHARHSASYKYMLGRILDKRPEVIPLIHGSTKRDLLKLKNSRARQARNS